jgi:wyosine [tRNA(Phe)-imidazoG37] synthetase (radical SAM superfamily)
LAELYQSLRQNLHGEIMPPLKDEKWEDTMRGLKDSDKVYNTLLKSRYALENTLIMQSK